MFTYYKDMEIRKKEIPAGLHIRAAIAPNSYKEEEREVEMTFATGTPVRRFDWREWEEFDEVLELSEAAVRLDRLNAGAPILKDHRAALDSVVGVVTKAWIENGEGRATVRFSERDDVAPILADIKAGILRNVSVGYKVHKYERQPQGEDEARPTYRAVDWEPAEVSLVAIPADHKSQLRSEEASPNFVTILDKTMKDQKETPAEQQPPVDVEALRAEAAKAERTRCAEIAKICRMAGANDLEEKLVSDGVAIDEARKQVMEFMFQNSATRGITNQSPITDAKVTGPDETDKLRDAISVGLALRSAQLNEADIEDKALVSAARQYRDKRLIDVARQSLIRSGMKANEVYNMSENEVAKRAITSSTSDFPILLEGTNRRVLLAAYGSIEDVWRGFCAVGSVGDFRPEKRLRMGTLGELQDLDENQEYKTQPITDADFEQVKVGTKGTMINISRKMIINDDLSGFTRLAAMLGRGAARSIEKDVFAFLALNSGNGGNLVDGNPIFHATHSNIVSTATFDADLLNAARIQMANQKDKDGRDFIGLRPSILLVPMEWGTQARLLNDAAFTPDDAGGYTKPNTVRGLFSTIIETPRLTGNQYYMFASPGIEPTVEVSFLNGVQEPYLEQNNPFNVDGIQWKMRLDYGVGGVGFRGALRGEITP